MRCHQSADGFTAVELLITLFVAAAFLATGFQLYIAIIRNGAGTNEKAIASDIAYTNLRQLAASNPTCSTSSALPAPTPLSGTSLQNATIQTLTYAPHGCPWTNNVMEVIVRVNYGTSSDPQEVTHALFVQR